MENYKWDGSALKEILEREKISYKEVERVSGISRQIIRNYAEGITKPSIESLITLADLFDVPLDFLCGRCDEETANNILENYHEKFVYDRRTQFENVLSCGNKYDKVKPGFIAPYPYNLMEAITGETIDYILTKDNKDGIAIALASIAPREKHVIEGYYRDDKNFEEIGQYFNVGRQRIRQIHSKAIRKLRHPSRINMIKFGYNGMLMKYEYDKKLRDLELREERLEQLEKIFNEKVAEYRTSGDAEDINNFCNRLPEVPQTLMTPIENLDLSVRAFNCLKRSNHDTVSDVIDCIEDGSIDTIRNMGRKTIEEIIYIISKFIGQDAWEFYNKAEDDNYIPYCYRAGLSDIHLDEKVDETKYGHKTNKEGVEESETSGYDIEDNIDYDEEDNSYYSDFDDEDEYY